MQSQVNFQKTMPGEDTIQEYMEWKSAEDGITFL